MLSIGLAGDCGQSDVHCELLVSQIRSVANTIDGCILGLSPLSLSQPRETFMMFKSRNILLGALILATIGGCAALKPKPKPMAAIVTYISEEYLNVNTDLSEERLTAAGITEGTMFTSTYAGERVEALLGTSYADVERGEWIAQIEEDGNMQLAISFGHAAMELGCNVGDTLWVHPK